MHEILLVSASFLACAVEMVEALTIVLAVGVTRGWRSAIIGTSVALAALAVVVAALGPALAVLPIDSLRLFVGGILLIFGLQWLRKAILRASGFKALHDEEEAFAAEIAASRAAGRPASGADRYALVISFKSTLLEGLEVAFIVITLGANQGATAVAAAGAVAALVAVAVVGALVRHPLSRVPENTLKFAVGVMLTSFGTFWAGEGVGVHWPGAEISLAVLIVLAVAWSLLFVKLLARPERAVTS